MLSTPTKYLPLAVLYALHSPLVLSAWCSASIYGTPIIADCKHALSWIPSIGKVPSDPQSQQPRIFAEPQHLPIPYGGVSNEYRPHAIVQLPKIWKHSKDTLGADVCGDVCLRCRCEASVSVSTAKAEDRRCICFRMCHLIVVSLMTTVWQNLAPWSSRRTASRTAGFPWLSSLRSGGTSSIKRSRSLTA